MKQFLVIVNALDFRNSLVGFFEGNFEKFLVERCENEGNFFIFTSDIFEHESTSQPTVNVEETIENSEFLMQARMQCVIDVES